MVYLILLTEIIEHWQQVKIPGKSQHVSKYRQRIQDAVDDIEYTRILEEEDAMAREAGEINDGDLVEDENANQKITLLIMLWKA